MNLTTFNDMLKEYHYIGSLSERDQAKFYLIERYKSKVSDRLLKEQKALFEEGQIAFRERLKQAVFALDPFLNTFKKMDLSDKFYRLPINYSTV